MQEKKWIRYYLIIISAIVCAVLFCGDISRGETSGPIRNTQTYYVNSAKGSDSATGLAPGLAWKTISRALKGELIPGDKLLLAGGQTVTETITLPLTINGLPGKPIIISSYGKGRAVLQAGIKDGITLNGNTYISINEINLVGCGRKNGSDGAGVSLISTRNISLENMDISGFRKAGISTGGDENTRILRIYAHDNGFAGITTNGGWGNVPKTRNLYIAYCVTDNNPGDPKILDNHSGNGIVVGGLEDGLIEYCEASNNGWDMPRQGNGPVGIWGFESNRLIIQHCISHDNKSPGLDGGGFDFDGGVTNSILQYNLSYNNAGCGYLLCQYPGASPWKNNIVRYNVSFNDGAKNMQSGIGLWMGEEHIQDCEIYNNTIINPLHVITSLGDIPGFNYRNNIFVAGAEMLSGSFSKSHFVRNLYRTSGQVTSEDNLTAIIADPGLILPSATDKLPTDPAKLSTMRWFRLKLASPALGAGDSIKNNGARDLLGTRVPTVKPSIGACEGK